MPEAPEPFASLLARARQEDPEALAQLVRQYESRVRLVARVLLGPALRPYLDTVDLVQSVHRTLMLGMRGDKHDISSPEKLVALALTLVRRKVARQWRRVQRQRRLGGGPADSGNLPELLLSLHSTEADPASAAQFNDALRHLCASLDAAEQRILELHLQGYRTAEIAAEMGLNPVALRVRLTRLRQRLRADGVLDDWL
jgi:RNA polymerase sigma-70 factor (ECF subfamily)